MGAKTMVVKAVDWIRDLEERVIATGLSLDLAIDAVRGDYQERYAKQRSKYLGGVDYEAPTKKQVMALVEFANDIRQQDLDNGETESDYCRNEPFTPEDIVALVDLCESIRK